MSQGGHVRSHLRVDIVRTAQSRKTSRQHNPLDRLGGIGNPWRLTKLDSAPAGTTGVNTREIPPEGLMGEFRVYAEGFSRSRVFSTPVHAGGESGEAMGLCMDQVDGIGDGAAGEVAVPATGFGKDAASTVIRDESVKAALKVDGGAGEALCFWEGPVSPRGDEVDVGAAGVVGGGFKVVVEGRHDNVQHGDPLVAAGLGGAEAEVRRDNLDAEAGVGGLAGDANVFGYGPVLVVLGAVAAVVGIGRDVGLAEPGGDLVDEGADGLVVEVPAPEEDTHFHTKEKVWGNIIGRDTTDPRW